MELTVITVILVRPIFGLARLWAGKTMYQTQSGSVSHGAAEIVAAIV